MRIIHALCVAACVLGAALARPFVAIASFVVALVPALADPRPALMLDNGHPRSPLASLRLGLA